MKTQKLLVALKYVSIYVFCILLYSCKINDDVTPQNPSSSEEATIDFRGLTAIKPENVDVKVFQISQEQFAKYYDNNNELKSVVSKLVSNGRNLEDLMSDFKSISSDVPTSIDYKNVSASDFIKLRKFFPELNDKHDVYENREILYDFMSRLLSLRLSKYYIKNVNTLNYSLKNRNAKTYDYTIFGLTWGEIWLTINNPFASGAVYDARSGAFNFSTQELGRLDATNTRRDALRHSVWSYLMAKNIYNVNGFNSTGAFFLSAQYGDAHEDNETELYNTTNYGRVMDLRNNHIGRTEYLISGSDWGQALNHLREKALWSKARFVYTDDNEVLFRFLRPAQYQMEFFNSQQNLVYINSTNDLAPCGVCLIND